MADKIEGIYKKILAIMDSVEYMPKDGEIEFGKTRYKYLSAEKIVQNIRKEMIAQKLILYPAKTEVTNQSGSEKDIIITYRMVDTEDGSSIEIQVPGGGYDSADKKTYKALTGAYKYALRQTFMIETGDDDPDKVASDKVKATGNPGKKQPAKMTETQIKNLFMKHHNGNTDEAKSDYALFVDMPEDLKQDTIDRMLAEVKS